MQPAAIVKWLDSDTASSIYIKQSITAICETTVQWLYKCRLEKLEPLSTQWYVFLSGLYCQF